MQGHSSIGGHLDISVLEDVSCFAHAEDDASEVDEGERSGPGRSEDHLLGHPPNTPNRFAKWTLVDGAKLRVSGCR